MHLNCVAFVLIGFVAVTADPAINGFVNVAHTPAYDRDNGSFSVGLSTLAPSSLGVEEKTLVGSQSSSNLYSMLSSFVSQSGKLKKYQFKIKTLLQPANAYYALGLHKVEGNLLKSPKWKFWAVHVGKHHKDDPDGAILKAMTDQLGLSRLMTIVAYGATDPATQSIANSLEVLQHMCWLKIEKKPADVFRELEIWNSNNVFTSLLYPTWSKYTTAFRHEYLSQDITELGAIRSVIHSDVDDLLKMLAPIDSVNNPVSPNVVNQFARILMNEIESPKQVFQMLMGAFEEVMPGVQRGTPPETIFQELLNKGERSNPLLDIWVDYMTMYPLAADPTIIKVINMLVSPDNTKSIHILRDVMQKWLEDGVPPYEVFQKFGLDENFLNLLDSPLVYIYINYMEKDTSSPVTLMATLNHFYRDHDVLMLETMILNPQRMRPPRMDL